MKTIIHFTLLGIIIAGSLYAIWKSAHNLKRKRTDEEEAEDYDFNAKALVGMFLAICLLIWVVGGFVTRWWSGYFYPQDDGSGEGVFGDSFGAINALLSALAFGGLIVSILMQQRQLELQRNELREQRNEYKKQNKTIAFQRFDDTFFNMMELHHSLVNGLKITCGDKTYEGRDVFRCVFLELKIGQYNGLKEFLEKSGLRYEDSGVIHYFDHYFRHLFAILKYIDDSEELLDANDKFKYSMFVRASLSEYEYVLLYYTGLTSYGRKYVKPLIEKYQILMGLRIESLALSKRNRDILGDSYDLEKASKLCYGLPITDYEFYLTTEVGNPDKYNITARFPQTMIHKGEKLCADFDELIKNTI